MQDKISGQPRWYESRSETHNRLADLLV